MHADLAQPEAGNMYVCSHAIRSNAIFSCRKLPCALCFDAIIHVCVQTNKERFICVCECVCVYMI
jgi:hypothetical protein